MSRQSLHFLRFLLSCIRESCGSFGIRHRISVKHSSFRLEIFNDSEFGLIQVVHFHEPNSGGVVYPTHDGGVVTRWEVCDDRRFARVRRSVAAVLNVLDLVAG